MRRIAVQGAPPLAGCDVRGAMCDVLEYGTSNVELRTSNLERSWEAACYRSLDGKSEPVWVRSLETITFTPLGSATNVLRFQRERFGNGARKIKRL
jgi:hypothetical protein